ncbi:MAG: type II toxin-antitoxin system VapC family toxin [Chroococcidiopsidaceae cyanobacterium CP_BM_ER_R8_30]|nr:type II toxin-antitoxin system VapC family toxin [Chroococcidiopsidaceae cyanobacterium CP_BM_ER_R8_30]
MSAVSKNRDGLSGGIALFMWVYLVKDRLRIIPKLQKIGRADLPIASIALANQAILVTRNLRHFKQIPGVKLLLHYNESFLRLLSDFSAYWVATSAIYPLHGHFVLVPLAHWYLLIVFLASQ